ncbi:MAG: DUF4430 domain-containing protein [Promethearchaeota archaeon]|jgi:hypothetical protein
MKNTKKVLSVIGVLVFMQIIFQSAIPTVKANGSIPTPYYQDLDINGTYVYNVTLFGGPAGWYNFTPWPNSFEGNWETTPGGQIKINFTDFYDKDPNDWGSTFGDPIPWLDIEILEYNAGSLTTNFTLNNRSNSEVARALTLGFNYFQSGFLIPTENLTQTKKIAINQSDPGGPFDIVGEVKVEETYNFFYIGFEQAGGGQQTYMIYDRETGILIWAKTKIFDYLLEIQSLNFTLDDDASLTYDVVQFGGEIGWYNFTPWPGDSFEGNWETNAGGQIVINFTGFYNKDPNDWGNVFNNPIAWFDIEIFGNNSGILESNFTVNNRSNSELAWALTLGYNNFQPGFHINNIDNLTRVKSMALQEASGFVPGIVKTEETELSLKFTFEQTSGGQITSIMYEKRTGILLWTSTSFGSYLLEMNIEGYTPWQSEEEGISQPPDTLQEFLPYIIISSIGLVSVISILAASKVNTKIRKLNKYFLIGIIAAASFASFFVFTSSIEVAEVGRSQETITDLTLIVDYGNGTIKTQGNFELTNYNTTAFHALVKWCEVEYKDFGGMGILVENIDGIQGNWRYSINGDFPGVSSDKYNLQNGDTIKWVFG